MSPPLRTYGLTHAALAVRDLERSVAFYQTVFGSVVVYRDDGFAQLQTPGSRDVLVLERHAAPKGRPGRAGGRVSGGVLHLGFRLVDPGEIAAAAELVERAGGTLRGQGEFVPGEPYLFCADPDGYEIEIWYELPTPVDPPAP
jgi:catechol 2,3-dioxygenase-like lactoylglutathione lyase family enzyme